MEFRQPLFQGPDFKDAKYQGLPAVEVKAVEKDGVAPDGFYLTTHLPTYYKVGETWLLPEHNSLYCVAVVQGDQVLVKEIRDLQVGDLVVTGDKMDGSQGILVYAQGFPDTIYHMGGKAVETSFSQDYKYLFDLMEYERDNGGYIVWVLGPSVVFDYDTRASLNKLAENGYIHCLMGGNAMCTHDLEGGFLQTALGQNIYTQENVPMGHYNHLDTLNEIRTIGSIKDFIAAGNVRDGIIKTLNDMEVPFVLSGSIRDDGPLPEVMGNMEEALTKTKQELDKATLIIGVATMLHSLSVANMASSYRIRQDGSITPVFMCVIDVTENVVNKVGAARGNMAFLPMVTNAQDFVVNCERALVQQADQMLAEEADMRQTEKVSAKRQAEQKGEMSK